MVADTGGPTGGLACHAGVIAPLTLVDVAERVARAEPVTGGELWAHGEYGLRVLAARPQFTIDTDRDAILGVLNQARQAHVLTVIDAGTLARRAEQAALTVATHIAWVLPANQDSVVRAGRVLDRIALLDRPEIVVARADPHGRKPPLAALCDLADTRRAPLILMPSFGELSNTSTGRLIDEAQVALQAIGGELSR
jgi:hypothetical protein